MIFECTEKSGTGNPTRRLACADLIDSPATHTLTCLYVRNRLLTCSQRLHHLKILKAADLVNRTHLCRDVCYRIDRPVIEDCSRAPRNGTFCQPPRTPRKGKRK